MNQPSFPSPDGTSRSFATDEPRTDLTTGRPVISNKLWAGMATAAVVAAVGVGAMAAPPASLNGSTTAAAQVAEAPAPPSASSAAPTPPAAAPGAAEAVAAQAAAPAAEAPAPPADPAPVPPPAAPEPAPAPVPEPAGDPNLYTVVQGDTVGAIAASHGVDMNAMLGANGLSAYSFIYPSETLLLTGPPIAVAEPAPTPAAAPAPAAAPVAAQASAPAAVAPAAPAVRTIYVAGSGGQSMVDACIGPIHYTPNDGYSVFITEHDFCGGWARFSGIGVGETVSIPGYGTYTVTGRGTVPNPGTTNDVISVFGGFPRAILQTCIPGTSTMLLVALN